MSRLRQTTSPVLSLLATSCLLSTGCVFGGSGSGAGGYGYDDDDSVPDVTAPEAQALLDLTEGCDVVGGDYAYDFDGEPEVPICGLDGAVFWVADMDIDCDGMVTSVCNSDTDPWFQPSTSMGDHIAASELPFVVIPLPSSRFAYADHDIDLGTVVAVLFEGQLNFGAFVDQGPEDIIGEASYAMADLFGIDHSPSQGGTPGPVTYIAFEGTDAQLSWDDVLDHDLAEQMGAWQAQQLVDRSN